MIETLLLLFLFGGFVLWTVIEEGKAKKRLQKEIELHTLIGWALISIIKDEKAKNKNLSNKKQKPQTKVTEVKAPPIELPKYWYIKVDKSHKNWGEFARLYDEKSSVKHGYDGYYNLFWYDGTPWLNWYNISSQAKYFENNPQQVTIDEAITIMQGKSEDRKYIYPSKNGYIVQIRINQEKMYYWYFSTIELARAKRDEILSKKSLEKCKK